MAQSPLFWDPHQLLWGLDRLLQGKDHKAPSGRGTPRFAFAILISPFLSPPLPAMWPDLQREGRQVYKSPYILPSLAANALNFMDSSSLFLAIKSQYCRVWEINYFSKSLSPTNWKPSFPENCLCCEFREPRSWYLCTLCTLFSPESLSGFSGKRT